jgi:hypothetical protein
MVRAALLSGVALACVCHAQTSPPAGSVPAPAASAAPTTSSASLPQQPAASRPHAASAHPPASARATANAHRKSPYHGMAMSEKAKEFYPAAWGVDRLQATYTSSGNLIRFSYRVVDATLAKTLGDHAQMPQLYAPRTHAMLQVPTMEQVGLLRQMGNIEAGKDYWVVFSNKGNLVRRGDRVNVLIGNFHAEGLLVQ